MADTKVYYMINKIQNRNIDNELQIPDRIQFPNEFLLFCKWQALPTASRKPRTQQALARSLNMSAQRLTEWKEYKEFNLNVRAEVKRLLGNDIPDIMDIVKKKALRGDNKSAELILKWLGDLVDQQNNYIDKAVVFTWQPDKDNVDAKPLINDIQ